jgi:hypothetical protein
MNKRDELWSSIWGTDGETIAWPAEDAERSALASNIVGATIVGAAEHVLGQSLDRLAGEPPKPGADDYQARLRAAKVFATLSDEQRAGVTRLLRETAYFSLYWPLAKLRNLPGVALRLVVDRCDEDGAAQETFDLTETLDPHQLFTVFVENFAEFLDPQMPLPEHWKSLSPEQAPDPVGRSPFTGELVTGQVIFSGPQLVLVRIADRNITVRVSAEVAKGETVRVGLSPDDQPRVIEIRGKRIDVPTSVPGQGAE